jgi:hypothetical protein
MAMNLKRFRVTICDYIINVKFIPNLTFAAYYYHSTASGTFIIACPLHMVHSLSQGNIQVLCRIKCRRDVLVTCLEMQYLSKYSGHGRTR